MAGLPWQLIHTLADGRCHSGRALGEGLGVSRAAVWKMIQQLQNAGLPVCSVKGQGYRIIGGLDLLEREVISDAIALDARGLLGGLHLREQTDSTNTQLLTGDFGCGDVMLAEQQTAGRGRRGRQWVSPLAGNLYLSVRWHFSAGMSCLEGLSLAVGKVVAECLEGLGVCGVALKWPNDIWVAGQKLAGILVEVGGDMNGECHAVIGLGVNVHMSLAASDAIDQPWTDLNRLGYQHGRNVLAGRLIGDLLVLLHNYQDQGFAAHREGWSARNALKGLQVSTEGSQSLVGTVEGVSPSGGLIVKTQAGLQELVGGEVSVRMAGD